MLRNFIIHQIFSEFLSPLLDFRTCATPVGKQRVFAVLPWSPFICFWDFLVGLVTLLVIGFTANNGFPRSIINIGTWHKHWRSVTFISTFSFSSLTVAWHSCSWWSRRAWGGSRMMTLLSWRCHWCWRMRTAGRTRWQARNHDRNEVLRVTHYPNPVLNEMWFWPLIHSKEYPFSSQSFPSDKTTGVSSKTFIVKNFSNSLTYTVASSCVCTSPLLWLS